MSIYSRSKRLAKEWLEIQKCPVANVCVEPLDNGSLDEWHGNIKGDDNSSYRNVVVHFIVFFPEGYPKFAPRIRLSCFVPHINVIQRSGGWEVCLDMLEAQPIGSPALPYQYWTSAFSMRSILVQLTSFLLCDGQPSEVSMGNIDRTIDESRQFVCSVPGCNHSPSTISPRFPSYESTNAAPLCFPSVELTSKDSVDMQARIFKRRVDQQQRLMQSEQVQHANKATTIGADSKEVSVDKKNDTSVQEVVVVKEKVEEKWVLVKKGGGGQPSVNGCVKALTAATTLANKFAVLLDVADTCLDKFLCSMCDKRLHGQYFSSTQLGKDQARKCNVCIANAHHVTTMAKENASKAVSAKGVRVVGAAPSGGTNTKAVFVDPNLVRRARRRQRKLQEQAAAAKNTMNATVPTNSASSSPAQKDIHVNGSASSSPAQKDIHVNGSAGDPAANVLSTAMTCLEEVGEWKAGWRVGNMAVQTDKNMSHFSILNRDTAAGMLLFLTATDIMSFGAASRGSQDMTDDWVVWKQLFLRRYPRSALLPSGGDAWKHAYMLEANCLSHDMHCFHTRMTKAEDVLGLPCEFTMNPKTHQLDYATSSFDVLSMVAFKEEGVRKTMWGEKFSAFIPYYIDQCHFERSLKQLGKVARDLVGSSAVTPREYREAEEMFAATQANPNQSSGGGKRRTYGKVVKVKAWSPCNEPEMILMLLTKMMNTQVVLLCDKGIEASEVALMGYCQLHRLLIAVVDTYPQLQALIRKRLQDFFTSPASRVKERTPSLGELLAYLSVSDSHSWNSIAMVYLFEAFDRSVLWACTQDPSLATVEKGDVTRLDRYLSVRKVSLRLTLFHACFLNMLVRGGGSRLLIDDCKDRYDRFQGRPPLHVRRSFHKTVQDILSFESWPDFFSIAKVPLPTKPQLLCVLEKAVANSLKKGYHSHNTVFQNVMRSGVSKILLKGETYSASPNLKKVRLLEKWKYDGDAVVYLDATCLVYDFSNKRVGLVDYSNQYWSGNGSNLCIEHSGDIVYGGVGEHSIDIDVSLLPASVKALFFTVSAWTTTLKSISQPSCHLHDTLSETELCRYKLEGTDTGDHTAVVMCKLHRFSASSRWELSTVGHVGYGRAGNYSSIYKDIKKFL